MELTVKLAHQTCNNPTTPGASERDLSLSLTVHRTITSTSSDTTLRGLLSKTTNPYFITRQDRTILGSHSLPNTAVMHFMRPNYASIKALHRTLQSHKLEKTRSNPPILTDNWKRPQQRHESVHDNTITQKHYELRNQKTIGRATKFQIDEDKTPILIHYSKLHEINEEI